MARTLSSLVDPRKDSITLTSVLSADIIPWLLSTGAALLVYAGAVLMAKESIASQPNAFETAAATASQFIGLTGGLVVLATIGARRAYRNIATWCIAVGLVLVFATPSWHSLSTTIFPNSILPAMVALLGVLAASRLGEYFYARYTAHITTLKMSGPAKAAYFTLLIGAVILLFPL